MKKEGAIYWIKTKAKPRKPGNGKRIAGSKQATPQWFIFGVVVSITFMLCLAINFRAFSEIRRESKEYSELNTKIDEMTSNNLALQEKIQNLKNDEQTIAREARKIGMSRSNEKVLVPTN